MEAPNNGVNRDRSRSGSRSRGRTRSRSRSRSQDLGSSGSSADSRSRSRNYVEPYRRSKITHEGRSDRYGYKHEIGNDTGGGKYIQCGEYEIHHNDSKRYIEAGNERFQNRNPRGNDLRRNDMGNQPASQQSSKVLAVLRKELNISSSEQKPIPHLAVHSISKNCRIEGNAPQSDEAGLRIADSYSRGNTADHASARLKPYHCHVCSSTYMMATQLSDHLLKAHQIRKHASLIKPKTEEEDDLKGFGQRGDIDPMDM